MKIGVPKEIKPQEYRVGLVPYGVAELVAHGHELIVEAQAGIGTGYVDDDYRAAGAMIAPDAAKTYDGADMIVKVKEPQPAEWPHIRDDHTIFAFLHLAADPEQAAALQASGCTAIAFETVTDDDGGLPLLAPMSEIAGRLSIQSGAHFLEAEYGGRGVLLAGVPGVAPGDVVILGGGMAGGNAARMAVGLGSNLTIIDRSANALRRLDNFFDSRVTTLSATKTAIEDAVINADLVIGAALVAGARAPVLISEELVRAMRPGAVFVDIAIDQGGIAETSRPTTLADPVYRFGEVVHYCVANMPGAVPRTSAHALTNAILPYALSLADNGPESAMSLDANLRAGLNVQAGQIVHGVVAEALS